MISTEFRKKVFISFAVALFFASTLFLFGPYRSFLNNITEFHISFYKTCGYFIMLAALAFFVLFGLMLLSMKKSYYQKVISVLFVLSVLIWLQGNVLVWNYGVMDGSGILFNKNFGYGVIEVFIWILLISASFYFSSFIYKIARIVSILLILTQIICLVYERARLPYDISWMDKYLDTHSKSFYRYSEDKNVVVLLLDGFPSFIFQEIIEEDPAYRKIFDGFTYYRNSLSGYPNTRASIANILTGHFYKNSEPFPIFIENVFEHNSLPKVLLDNGYQVDALEENTFICCPDVFSNCVSDKFSQEDILAEFFILNKITLFRHSPHFVKKHSNLVFPGKFFDKDAINRMDLIINRFYIDGNKPVFKFYHLASPHPPILFNEKLQRMNLEVNRENFVRYAKGSLNIAKMFIDKLIDSEIYDNTLIFIISDHGYDWPMKKNGKYETPKVDARALPLVLVKPFSSRGKLMVSDAPVHLQDIPATVMSALNLKENVPGVSIFELKDSNSRERLYLQYTSINDNDAEKIMYMVPLYEYIVRGFSWANESWQMSGKTFMPAGNDSENQTNMVITADKFNINSPPEFVNRNSPTLFWEAGGGYPYWIKFEFTSGPKKINKYALKTGIHDGAAGEMPKDWLFQGSNDGINWVTLDVRQKQINWEKNEERTYNVKNKESYNCYRLYFVQGNRPDHIRIYEISLK
ncbi:MAG: sulfatase-like hydrolase/transferase [Sedimentisphaerales bacterium]